MRGSWGAAHRTLPEGAHTEGIELIPGRHLIRWLESLEADALTKAAASDLG